MSSAVARRRAHRRRRMRVGQPHALARQSIEMRGGDAPAGVERADVAVAQDRQRGSRRCWAAIGRRRRRRDDGENQGSGETAHARILDGSVGAINHRTGAPPSVLSGPLPQLAPDLRGEVLSLTVELPQSCELREFLKFGNEVWRSNSSEESAYATAVCGARTTDPRRRVPERDLCAVLTSGVIRFCPTPDQHQRRLPARQRPAGRRGRDRHPLDLCRPGGRGAPLAGDADHRARCARAATRCSSAPPRPDGIPAAVFGSGDAQWLGTVFERAGEVEGPRVRITSVPYALRASDADTLGGRPASDYLLTRAAARDGVSAGAASVDGHARRERRHRASPASTNFLAKYVNGGADVGNSAVYETPPARSASAPPRRSTPCTSASTAPAARSPATRSRTRR